VIGFLSDAGRILAGVWLDSGQISCRVLVPLQALDFPQAGPPGMPLAVALRSLRRPASPRAAGVSSVGNAAIPVLLELDAGRSGCPCTPRLRIQGSLPSARGLGDLGLS
jgi:hypothetical protein